MIDAIVNSWLFEPFAAGDYVSVVIWYTVSVIGMAGVAYAQENVVGVESDTPFPAGWSIWRKLLSVSVMAPLIEETLFRILPIGFGFTAGWIVFFSIVWALMHRERAPTVMVKVPLYVKMTLAGMFVPMILLHAFHNTWAVLYEHYIHDSGDEESVDLYDHNDVEHIIDLLQEDNGWNPTIVMNDKSYDSVEDIPLREWRRWLEDSSDDE